MKKYLTVGYAYPVYFLLILGQYFLAESLDSLYDPPAGAPTVAQPAQHPPGASGTIPGTNKEVRTASSGTGRRTPQAGNNHRPNAVTILGP